MEATRKHETSREDLKFRAPVPDAVANEDGVGRLQQILGNRGIQALVESGSIPAKSAFGQQHDGLERQADKIGEQIAVATEPLAREVRPDTHPTGMPLPKLVRATIEPRIGIDLDPVRLFTDRGAGAAVKALGAHAFTSSLVTAVPCEQRRDRSRAVTGDRDA